MVDQRPLRILSLDGGGVRGLSSLYILKDIIAQTQREQRADCSEPSLPAPPSHLFDLICGTSTGGLIALMLGRLELTIDDAISKYSQFSEAIFGALSKTGRGAPEAEAPLPDSKTCKVFVVATRTRAGGAPVLMRSYNTRTSDAFSALIWEAARATSAAPTFFAPIIIRNVSYADGGTGWNNPTAEAIREAHKIWPGRPIGCLLSIGTGLESPIRLKQRNESSSSYSNLLETCETIHREVSAQYPDRIVPFQNYFRFNVAQGLSSIELDEWAKIGDIIALTDAYMEHPELEERKIRVAKLLLNPQLAEFPGRNMKLKCFMVHMQENPLFVGREALLEQLTQKLNDRKPHQWNQRVALFGTGGVGKTQAALAYVYTRKWKYDSIFWLNGIDKSRLLFGFLKIASLTDCISEKLTQSEAMEWVLKWLEEQSKWLLIIDNLDDVSVVDGCLPTLNSQGHILITTRNPHTSGIPAQGLEVPVMDFQEGVDMFRAQLNSGPRSRSGDNVSDIGDIVNELGCLPLAIEQAAAFIRETGYAINRYLPLYRENRSTRKRLTSWRPEGNREYKYTVATTWKLSFALLEDTYNLEAPNAAPLLQLFAFLNHDLILLDFLQAGSNGLSQGLHRLLNDPMSLSETLRVLERLSLIKRIQDGQGVSIHRLIQEVMQCDLTEDEWQDSWENISKLCLHAFSRWSKHDSDTITRGLWVKYGDQTFVPLSKNPQTKSATLAEACNQVGIYLNYEGRPEQAAILLEKACRISKEIYGDRHPTVFAATSNLATCYADQGRTEESIPLLKTCLEMLKEIRGERDPSTLTAMHNLAHAYAQQGRAGWNEAACLEKRVWKARKEVLGPQHPDTLVSMMSLGTIYSTLGRLDKAAVLQEAAVKISKAALGSEHVDTMTALSNLAVTYMEQGKLDRCVSLHVAVLRSRKKILGDNHPHTILAMNNLATTYAKQGDVDKAYQLLDAILYRRKKALGDSHPATLGTMVDIAMLLFHGNRLNQALQTAEKVLRVDESVLSPNTRLKAKKVLALIYLKKGEPNRSKGILSAACEEARKKLSVHDPTFRDAEGILKRLELLRL